MEYLLVLRKVSVLLKYGTLTPIRKTSLISQQIFLSLKEKSIFINLFPKIYDYYVINTFKKNNGILMKMKTWQFIVSVIVIIIIHIILMIVSNETSEDKYHREVHKNIDNLADAPIIKFKFKTYEIEI